MNSELTGSAGLDTRDWGDLEFHYNGGKLAAFQKFLRKTDEKHLAAAFLRKELQADDTVLDIGAGTGILTILLADYVKEVVAIEPNEEYLRELEKKINDKNLNNIETINKCWCDVELDREYDSALFSHSLHLIEDKERAIKKMDQVTQGSNYVITNGDPEKPINKTFAKSGKVDFAHFFRRYSNELPDQDYFRTNQYCERICQNLGLRVYKRCLNPRVVASSDEEFLKIFSVMFGRDPDQLSENLKLRVLDYFNMNQNNSTLSIIYPNVVTRIRD
jgi:ubiquinone/menaquinone biosynthesis C-methylase UbiE